MIQILVNTSRPGKYLSIFILEKTFSGILNHISLAKKGLKVFGQDLEIPATVEREKSAKTEKPAKSEPAPKGPTPAAPAPAQAKAEVELKQEAAHPASEVAAAVVKAAAILNEAPPEDQVQIPVI